MENEESFLENESTVKKSNNIVPYWKLYKYSSPFDLLLICMGIICSIITGILHPFLTILFGEVIGVFASYFSSLYENVTQEERLVLNENFLAGTQQYAVNATLCGVIGVFCTYVTVMCFTYSSIRQTLEIRKLFFGKILDQDINWHQQNKTEDIKKVITENILKIEEGIGRKVGIVITIQTTLGASVMWAHMRGWKFAWVCFTLFFLKTIISTIIMRFFIIYINREKESNIASVRLAAKILLVIHTVVAFGGEEKESKRYSNCVKQAQDISMKRRFIHALNLSFYWSWHYASYALALWYGMGLIIEERSLPEEARIYTEGNVMAIFLVAVMASWHFGKATGYIKIIKNARAAAYMVFKILDSKPVMNKCNIVGEMVNLSKPNIVFKNVSFSYPVKPHMQVLSDISFEVSCAETVALVGLPGSGKSTIVKLIQRSCDPTSGLILVNGVDLKKTNLSYLMAKVGIVDKDPSLFTATVADNIRFGKWAATMDDIVKAAKKAHAHKFICDLPLGYQTILGQTETQLSQGQQQLISLARALIKEPFLLILDDVTSLLNSTDELEVQAALNNINEECTTLVITDKLSTLQSVDKIMVLEKGKIIGKGSHRDLIEAKGTYCNIINSKKLLEPNNKDEYDKLLETERLRLNETGKNEDKNLKKEKEDMDRESFKNICLKLLKFNKPEWCQMITGCLGALLNGASTPLYGIIFGNILGVLSITDNVVFRSKADSCCLDLLYLGIATGITVLFQTIGFGDAERKLTYRLRTKMFSTMLRQEMGWFDRKENGISKLCVQLTTDPYGVREIGGLKIGSVLSLASTLFLSTVIGLYINWKLTLLVGIFSPLIIWLTLYERKYISTEADINKKLSEKSVKIVEETIDHIETVKALGCEHALYKLYLTELVCLKFNATKRSHIRAVILGFARSLYALAYASGITYGAKLLLRSEIDSSSVFKILAMVISSATIIGTIVLPNKQKGTSAASRIFALFDRVPTIKNHANSIQVNLEHPNIKFSRIVFSYPARPDVQILSGLDFSIINGKTVALLGCGRLTLIHLLMRFYDPVYGAVDVNGEDIRNINLDCLRSQVGLVRRRPNLFELTVAENIAYGVNDRIVSIEDIMEAAKSANIHNTITNLPLGYETKLGTEEDQLSVDQKQRISIARLLLRNPKILLLEEATSDLVGESKKVVEEVLDNARQGRTCIVVSENLATIQKADVICFLKNGLLEEMGSHDELFAKKRYYYEYYKLHFVQQ